MKLAARFTARFTPDGLPLLGKDGAPARSRRIAYTGTAEKAGGFRTLLRGFTDGPRAEADAVEITGDGAEWIAKTTEELFGEGALSVVDFCHAADHAGRLVDTLAFRGAGAVAGGKRDRFRDRCVGLLRRGDVAGMPELVRDRPQKRGQGDRFAAEWGYFKRNAGRMEYGLYTALGLPAGSGVIEAGVKMIVSGRLKRAGMRWSKRGAHNMIALRCGLHSAPEESSARTA